MSNHKFNRVFIMLLLISGAASFLVPLRFADATRGRIDLAFSPVASPLRRIVAGVSERVSPPTSFDSPASPTQAAAEIERLRAAVASLSLQNAELRQISAGREAVGEVRNFSVPVAVNWNAPTTRDILSISISPADGVLANMPVVHTTGLVGKIGTVGNGVANVRMVTDSGMRMMAAIGAFEGAQFKPRNLPPTLVEGAGNGVMKILNLKTKDVQSAGIKVGDWVVLHDREDWPLLLYGAKLGQIEKIDEQTKAIWFADITVRPRTSLQQLREVFVVTGRQANSAHQSHPGVKFVNSPIVNPAKKQK